MECLGCGWVDYGRVAGYGGAAFGVGADCRCDLSGSRAESGGTLPTPAPGSEFQQIREHAALRPWSLVRTDVRLWAPLLVFWLSNLGAGDLTVVEPVMVHAWHAPAFFFYGLLGAVGALMATVGAWF